MFVGCRTHSTIAAYSTCVPTLVVGYSIKSRGIAKDLFGDYKDLVIPIEDLENGVDLVEKFIEFSNKFLDDSSEKAENIRNSLNLGVKNAK